MDISHVWVVAAVVKVVVVVMVVVLVVVVVVLVVVMVERGNLPAALCSSLEFCPPGSPCIAAGSTPSFYSQTPSSPEYSTVQYSAVQYSTVQYSTVQCTIQYSTEYSTLSETPLAQRRASCTWSWHCVITADLERMVATSRTTLHVLPSILKSHSTLFPTSAFGKILNVVCGV